MKTRIFVSALALSLIIIAAFSGCEKKIVQTDKPLYDVIAGKIWTLGESFVLFKDDGVYIEKKNPVIDTTNHTFEWYLQSDTIVITISFGWRGDQVPVLFYSVEEYSEVMLRGRSSKPYSDEEREFTFEIFEE